MTARAAALALAVAAGCAPAPDAPTVFSAASTADVVRGLAPDVVVSVAASSVLARQIARGAPADVFLTADPAWIDGLEREGVGVLDRRVVARGALVVVGPLDGGEAPFEGRLALADPTHVPAGRYARRALEATGRWEAVGADAVRTGDVRAALAAVEAGGADRAVVYASDAAASRRVRVLHRFAEAETGPVVFEAALLRPAGRVTFERLGANGEVWQEAGFLPPGP